MVALFDPVKPSQVHPFPLWDSENTVDEVVAMFRMFRDEPAILEMLGLIHV